jgi:uncharacterized protein (DUF58 family)
VNATELLKKIRAIDIQTKGWVDSIFSGAYHSRFKGQGVHFNEVRQYAVGDDVRRIDWTVTAKLNEPYIKEFEEERDLNVIIAVDMSQSQFYQSTKDSKLDRALEIAAVLGFSAVTNGDQVGLLLFTDTVEAHIPAKQGKKHMYAILSRLLNHQPASNQTNIKKLCQTIMSSTKRKSVVIILSDFIDDNYEVEFRQLAQKHDVVPIIIQDPIEQEIPASGIVALKDTESGETVICDTKDHAFQSSILSVLNSQRSRRERLFQTVGVQSVNISTTESYIEPLKKYFKSR